MAGGPNEGHDCGLQGGNPANMSRPLELNHSAPIQVQMTVAHSASATCH